MASLEANRCTQCDCIVHQDEPYRAMTDEERTTYPHLGASTFVAKTTCPSCGEQGLGLDWRSAMFVSIHPRGTP